jgi:hypothetical protein
MCKSISRIQRHDPNYAHAIHFVTASSFNYDKLWEQGHIFTQALDRLGKTLDDGTVAPAENEDSLETKLIAIAYHRAQRQQDFDEIESVYTDAARAEKLRRPLQQGYLFSPQVAAMM